MQPGAALRPWLLGIARHVALDARRARTRDRKRDAGDAAANAVDQLETSLPDPHAHAESAQRAEHLRRAFQELPAPQRQALALHADGLGYREIAAELGVPLGTVCTWIARSRHTLARALREPQLSDNAPNEVRP
jgi:RNA polymerase sigma-70 factor (ECF subfamily)